ncbi:hypothetical protein GJ629_00690 [Halapricum sp. CBA1109]|uniref:hypothetical protein n=1 Tax=Halapricum sp. CBA1109 TaxID=2668068 RepID=UPI0012F71234|nr:hypothetical protein [Halapricum sp. CBA1109]MUV88585.1 hypothetical protein [Halapricum sp. CBA1109]
MTGVRSATLRAYNVLSVVLLGILYVCLLAVGTVAKRVQSIVTTSTSTVVHALHPTTTKETSTGR